MTLRPLSCAALATTALLTAAPTAPTTIKYRIDQTVGQALDASAIGGPKQQMQFTMSSFVTITLADTAGGRTMHVVVDSMQGDSTSPIPQEALDSARGSTFHGFVAPTGKITNLAPVKATLAATQLQGVLATFYPRTKDALKVGDGWNDTTEVDSQGGNGTMRVRTVTAYRAAGNETRDAAQAIRIDATFDQSLKGTQQTPGGTANIEGTGTGTGTYYMGVDGRYLGGVVKQTASLKVAGLGPVPVPVELSQQTTVSALR